MKKQVKWRKLMLLDTAQLDQRIGVEILMYIKISVLVNTALL